MVEVVRWWWCYGWWWCQIVERERESSRQSCCVYCVCEVVFVKKKTNPLLLADCRHLVHLFSCRCLQMWSADCRPFTSEKTNNTLVQNRKISFSYICENCYFYQLFQKVLGIHIHIFIGKYFK
ncbi:hypothetical protein Hanom_Chr05g00442891 [Helianthus anomalus]